MPHELPEVTSNVKGGDVDLSTVEVREAKNDFFTLDKVSKRRELEITIDKILCNQRMVWPGKDAFNFTVDIANSGEKKHMFTSLKIEYKMLNGDVWYEVAADDIDYGYGKPFPMTLQDMDGGAVQGLFKVPHYFGNNDANVIDKEAKPSFYRSTIARHKPLRFRFSFVTGKGETVSKVAEYVQPIGKLSEPYDYYKLFLTIDDPETISRIGGIYFYPGKEGDKYRVLEGSHTMSKDDAQKFTQLALAAGKTEWPLENWNRDKEETEERYWALIDKACQCVYAVKVGFYFFPPKFSKFLK